MTNYDTGNIEKKAETVVDKAAQIGEEAKDKLAETTEEAKIQARRTANKVGETAKSTVESRMSDVAHELSSVADAVRQTTYEVGRSTNPAVQNYGSRIADQLEGISSYVDEHGVEDILADAEEFGRRRPVVFLGGAFMLGLVIGRFLRSSTPDPDTYGLDRYEPGHTTTRYQRSSDQMGGVSGYGGPNSGYEGRPPTQTNPTGTTRTGGTASGSTSGSAGINRTDLSTGGTGADNDRTNASVKTHSKSPATRDSGNGSSTSNQKTVQE